MPLDGVFAGDEHHRRSVGDAARHSSGESAPLPQRREGANPGLVGFTGTLVVTDPVDLYNLGVESVFVAGQ